MTRNILILLSFVLLTTTHIFSQSQNNFEISKNLDIYATLMQELDKNYAEEINPGELTETAIQAMLESLDPYTVYIPESRVEDFKLMTTGQYGGIGSLIHKEGKYVVVSEPYEGFPAQKAGLIAGDKILEVNGESAVDKTSSEISEILKGQPGMNIELKIQRYGEEEPQTIELVRQKIRIPNVPYYGMLDGDIGYIKLTNFTKNAGNEVKKSFVDLRKNNTLSGLVLDLRGNGGGLLNEAVDIVNLFVDKGQVVVSTKGKITAKNYSHKTRYPAVDAEIPLVVLVDKGSASASEIVAGALQDLDRAVVIGQRTFGKGLVQNVIPISYNSQMKVTVAKYYIPSGRCIQEIDYFDKEEDAPHRVPDSLISEFITVNGRKVYDGGGIEPDITTESFKINPIGKALYGDFLIFNYCNKYYSEHAEIDPPETFSITENDWNDFVNFLEDKEIEYKTKSEAALEELKVSAQSEGYFEAIEASYNALHDQMIKDKSEDLQKNRQEIEKLLAQEIVSRYYYQKGQIIVSLYDDPEIKKAKELIENQGTYSDILAGEIPLDKSN